MKLKKAVVWWLVTETEPPVLTVEDKKIESLMPLVQALFPGINYYSMSGFSEAMHTCVMPALKKLFPEFQVGPAGSIVTSEEEVEIGQFLPANGYEWQDSEDWRRRFTELLAA